MKHYEVVICNRCKTRYIGNCCPVCGNAFTDFNEVDKFENDYTDLGFEI